MTKEEAIDLLAPYAEEVEFLTITISTGRKSVSETCNHYGTWNGHDFTCNSTTYWRSAEVEAEMDAEELRDLLVAKNLDEMTSADFSSMSLGEASDGDTDVTDIEWDGEAPTDEEMDENEFSAMDLYWDSDIGDCECEFEEVVAIRFELDGVKYVIGDEE